MRRFATAITLAILALVLTASVTMAAPRISPKGTSTDAGLLLGWNVGASVDYNMPMSKTMSMRAGLDVSSDWFMFGWFDINASASFIFPIFVYEDFEFALQAGPQAGFETDAFYVGGTVGVVAEYKFDNQWSIVGESAYGPGIEFDPISGVGYHDNGRYGFYVTYVMDKSKTLMFGERSINWYPGFYIGMIF